MSDQSDMALRRIEAEIRRRTSTDRRMGYAWMIVPILPPLVIIAVVAVLVGLVISSLANIQGIGSVGSAAGGVAAIIVLYVFTVFALYTVLLLGALAFYYFIDRRNRHFKRQQLLFSAIPTYLLATGSMTTHEQIARLVEFSEDSAFEEVDRPAGLWAVASLFATPIVVLIVAYNLTLDLRKHEERQLAFQQTLPLAFEEAGVARPALPPSRSHNRDPLLYVVLSAITAGIFWIYWFYTLLKDYNEHFNDQAVFEDQILAALKPTITCAACHASIPQNVRFCPLCGAPQPGTNETPTGA